MKMILVGLLYIHCPSSTMKGSHLYFDTIATSTHACLEVVCEYLYLCKARACRGLKGVPVRGCRIE